MGQLTLWSIDGKLPPGLRVCPGFLSNIEHDSLLDQIDAQPWNSDLKRRTQHYGYRYDYTDKTTNDASYIGPLPDFLAKLAFRLKHERLLGELNQVIINEYLPGQGIGPHIDAGCFGPIVACISLGWEYEMVFERDDERDDVSMPVMLPVGSLIVMEDEVRSQWRHSIAHRLSDHGIERKRRVSVTFRSVTL